MIPDVTSIASPGFKGTPKEVAAKVQGMFMEVMLKSMEDSVDAEDGLFGNSASADIYRGMMREKLASTMTSQIKSPLEAELGKALNKQSKPHAAAPAGTPIKAVADGRVIESGAKGGNGNTVVVQAEDGHKMLYPHNKQNFVQAGDWVSRGEEIAEVGSTGRATGPHVHFEVKF